MNVAIIENSDDAEIAEFITDEDGCRRLFPSYHDAEDWLMKNAEPGVVYQKFGDD
jgi:hypothetical protein